MKNKAVNILKSAKLKITPARLAILALFSRDCRPINAEYIIAKLKKKKVDSVTVYRTIDSLRKAGLINAVDLRQDSAFYERADHHHHHFVCTDCGDIEKLASCNVSGLVKRNLQKSKKFSRVDNHSFELFGVCNDCLKK